jgi:hypothetical protein
MAKVLCLQSTPKLSETVSHLAIDSPAVALSRSVSDRVAVRSGGQASVSRARTRSRPVELASSSQSQRDCTVPVAGFPLSSICDTLYYMKLSTAMLADGAHVAGGKLYVLGGQWDRLTVAAFPAQHPSMAVVLVIQVEYTEAPKSYTLTVDLTLDGQPQEAKATGQLAIGHAPAQARGAPQYVPVAIPFNNVAFGNSGRYEWVIAVDGDELGRLPIEVVSGFVPGAQPGSVAEAADG